MRALLISLLVFSAAPGFSESVWAQEAAAPPPQAAPAPAPAQAQAVPVVPAPPAADAPISADQAVDPLADLIAQSGPQTTDEEESAPPAQVAPHKPTILPIPERDPDEINPNQAIPQGGYIPQAEAYDLRVKGSILAAQGLQGPLDGGWSIDGPDGTTLYRLQLVDKVGGLDGLEGAWRDVRRPGTVGSTGLIDFVDRSYGGFLARFSPKPGQLATLDLTARSDGAWTGKLNENGVETPVVARRVAQATLPAGYVPVGRGPVIWGAPRPAAPRATAEAPAKTAACPTRGKTGKALKAAKAKCAAAAKKAGKGKATTAKGKKGKAAATKGKGSAKGKAAAKKKKR